DLTKRFTEDLIKYEEEKKMPYIMSAERIGKEKGLQQGMQQGIQQGIQQGMLTDAREMVLEALDARFSKDVPEDVYEKVQALNNRILLKKLLRSAAQSEDIDSFKKVLQEIHSQQPEG
ncbi:hypothetical protein JWG43_17730, partial [Desulfobulbus alkaliphilus]